MAGPAPPNPFLSGGGEAGEVLRSVDWAATPLGPPSTWSHALRTTACTLLHSRHPMFLWWGPELIQLYNDAYRPSLGADKHPAAMGQRGADCWREIWPVVHPQIEGAMERGEATYHEDQLVPIIRNGRWEEVFWTYGYTPIHDDDGSIGGCLVVCTETTGRALAQRRLGSLQALSQAAMAEVTMRGVMEAATRVLDELATPDVMFALLYEEGDRAPSFRVGLDDPHAAALDAFVRPQLASRADTHEPLGLPASLRVQCQAWPELVEHVIVESIGEAGGFLVVGLSPRLAYDQAYGDYLAQIAAHLTVGKARAAAFQARALVEHERDNLLLQAPVAIAILTGPNLVYQLVNERYCALVGRQDLVGKAYLEAFPELVGAPVTEAVFGAYRTGQRFSTKEMCIRLDRGDGVLEDRYFSFVLEPMHDPSGAVYGLMGLVIDITAQVGERKQLEAVQVKLVDANRAKDEFLAVLGHELRNPLSPIITAVELLRMRDHGSRELEIIERQLGQVVTLVDDLLDVARISRGEVILVRERVAAAEIVRRAVEQTTALLERAEHRLTVEVDEQAFVDGDPGRLAQAIANLLTNAAKYTDRGGSIQVHVSREHAEAIVRVLDDGIGLAMGDTTSLFQAFRREGRSAATSGLGVGLAVVKSLIEAHGGSVSLHSDGVGRGTCAEVRLPLADHSVARRSPTPASYENTAMRRVLIVDDNEDAASMLALALESLGHEVRVAPEGRTALQLAAEYVPDIAFLDLSMPVMDGYTLAAELRRRADWAGVRLVAVTGFGQDSDRARTRESGFDAHLVKPVQLEDIVRELRTSSLGDG